MVGYKGVFVHPYIKFDDSHIISYGNKNKKQKQKTKTKNKNKKQKLKQKLKTKTKTKNKTKTKTTWIHPGTLPSKKLSFWV